MNPNKTVLCNGCLLGQLRALYGSVLTLTPRPDTGFPGAVEVGIGGSVDVPGVEVVEGERFGPLLLLSPDHSNDGDCAAWVARMGEAGVAWHLANELGILPVVYAEAMAHIPQGVRVGRRAGSRRRSGPT